MKNLITTTKLNFHTELLKLTPKEGYKVNTQIVKIMKNPLPDGKIKVKVRTQDNVYRIRAGDWRIFYTFDESKIALLSLRRRNEKTYSNEEKIDADMLAGFSYPLKEVSKEDSVQSNYTYTQQQLEQGDHYLPYRINEVFLQRLKIPEEHWGVLLPLKTRFELLFNEKVPDNILEKIDISLFERPIDQVITEPDYLLNDVEDLTRYKNGELLGFILKLSEYQENVSKWRTDSESPTLVRGGPGTGKSTVALYRVREMLDGLKSDRVKNPSILFTTYTTALIKYSRQLLDQLLGPEQASSVKISTADEILYGHYQRHNRSFGLIKPNEFHSLVLDAMVSCGFDDSLFPKVSDEYLCDELTKVIQANGISNLGDYLSLQRAGRKTKFLKKHRIEIWKLHLTVCEDLNKLGKVTSEQMRQKALETIKEAKSERYDGVIVDEAQDLDPNTLRGLVALCKSKKHFFLAADIHQSIYRVGFSWKQIHYLLDFRGKSRVLSTNYRNTRQIMEAANSYLQAGNVQDIPSLNKMVHEGLRPEYHRLGNLPPHEILGSFIIRSCRELGMGLSGAAVLCRNRTLAKDLAETMSELNLPSTFVDGDNLDLRENRIKFMTCHLSKGLEFPIVSVVGDQSIEFLDSESEQGLEWLLVERSLYYVSMTRAMRRLLVIAPDPYPTALEGLSDNYWKQV